MKDVTQKIIAPYFHKAYFEKKIIIPFKRYLFFNDIDDILTNYSILIRRDNEKSLANLIENKYESWKKKNLNELSAEHIRGTLRLHPYDDYRPDLSLIWGQVEDVRIEHLDTDIRYNNIITSVRLYDNVFRSIDGVIINNIYNNNSTLSIVDEIFNHKDSTDTYTIKFIGLPVLYSDNSKDLKIGSELLLIHDLKKQEDFE